MARRKTCDSARTTRLKLTHSEFAAIGPRCEPGRSFEHPPELLGDNTGATAIETFLAALGACMTGTFAAQATARGVELEALEVDIEGVIDLNGFFGLEPINPGLYGVKLAFRAQSDAQPDALQEILAATESLSPIFNTTTKEVAVEATIAPS